MSSTTSSAGRLVIPFARPAAPAPAGPRHLAPGADDARMDAFAIEAVSGSGRHAEPEWSRELFDARRDDDAFAWLGFSTDEN
jgi:hypothetical protein